MEATLICSLCGARSPSLTLWMSHLRQVHEAETNITVSCPATECGAVYSKVNSLCSHIYRRHKDLSSIHVGSSTAVSAKENSTGVNTLKGTASEFTFDFCFSESLSHDVNQLLHRDAYEQKKESALFLMQLKEERLLTQAAVNDVVSGCKKVFEYSVCHLKAGVSQTLSKAGIDFKDIDGLGDVFSDISDPFIGLESAYLQDKFITEELGCIVSQLYFYH